VVFFSLQILLSGGPVCSQLGSVNSALMYTLLPADLWLQDGGM